MTTSWWLPAGCLVAVALAVAWPAGSGSGRLKPARRVTSLLALVAQVRSLPTVVVVRPRRVVGVTAIGLAVAGWLAGGVIAGVLAAIYGALTARALVRRSARARAAAGRARGLDNLAALAADLRAGLPPAAVLPTAAPAGTLLDTDPFADFAPAPALDDIERFSSVGPGVELRDGHASSAVPSGVAWGSGHPMAASTPTGDPAVSASAEDRIAELTRAVWRLAERTGAPAAELVERIEADARAADRAQASAAAQSAGAQATALLLAALPLGGIALGYGIGVDPLRILLHTTLGGACAIGAALLQTAGLLWADRLTSGPPR